jgi:hypothetical protein
MTSRAINFRSSTEYVTDGTGEGTNSGNSGFNADSGLTVAWSVDMYSNSRDRSSSVDRRLAGIVFQANDGTTRDFTITLPDGAGTYEIGLALGDASNAMPDIRAELLDNTTSFAVITGATASGEFLDATGVVRTAAAWPAGHVLITRVMSSTSLVLRLGKTGTGSSPVAHIYTNKLAADTTAPTLTSPTGTQTGSSTATIGATTDEANGTMYGVVTVSGTAPSVAQIQAGQDNSGSAAAYASNQSITTTGAKTFSATGLAASTSYYAHFQHKDAAANDSTVVTSAQFTTTAGGGSSGVAANVARRSQSGINSFGIRR